MTRRKVFISHGSADREFVETEIVRVLSERGFEPWYSKTSIHSSTEWEREIRKGLNECEWFLVVISAHAIASKWVKAEVDWAMEHRWGRIAPVLVERCDPGELHLKLPQIQHIAFVPSRDTGRQQLHAWIDGLKYVVRAKALDRRVVLTILGARGGVGKSTLACRMAEMMAETGHSVLLVDLDTGAAGTTSLQRARGHVSAVGTSTYELLEALAVAPRSIPKVQPIDVTPDYLLEREDCGRVYLLPATTPNRIDHMPTETLLRQIIETGNGPVAEEAGSATATGIKRVIGLLLATADGRDPPVDCIIFDCGAEGAEFNPLVPEVHRRADLTYVVVEPGSVSRDNLPRVVGLLTRGARQPGVEKVRVIVNKVYSSQHQPVARTQFSDYVVAGCVPHDQQLFEDIQKGRANHRHGYDKLSAAVREVLAYGKELPPELLPDEKNLWIRPTARAVIDGNPLTLFRDAYGRSLFPGCAVLLLGLTIVVSAAIQFAAAWPKRPPEASVSSAVAPQALDSPSQFDAPTRTALFTSSIVFALGVVSVVVSVTRLGRCGPPLRVAWQLRSIARASREPRERLTAVEEYLTKLYATSPDSAGLKWLREAVKRPSTGSMIGYTGGHNDA